MRVCYYLLPSLYRILLPRTLLYCFSLTQTQVQFFERKQNIKINSCMLCNSRLNIFIEKEKKKIAYFAERFLCPVYSSLISLCCLLPSITWYLQLRFQVFPAPLKFFFFFFFWQIQHLLSWSFIGAPKNNIG
jgi:hypothetical protein